MDPSEDRFPLHTAAREGRVSIAEGLLKVFTKNTLRNANSWLAI
jgi:hypothetical protein